MKKHFYAEYNNYGMISYNSFGGPGKNGYIFLQFATLEELNAFLGKNEFSGCNLVARRCKYADVVKNVGKNFKVLYGVCIRSDTWGGVSLEDRYDAQAFSNVFDLE